MSVTEAPVRLGIELCDINHLVSCVEFSTPLAKQLSSGKYDVCATMPLPRSRESWEADHRTARKRAWRADNLGYWADTFDRQNWHGDMHEVNISRPYRQGRPMTRSYHDYPEQTPLPDYPCGLHAVRYYGVFHGRWGESAEMAAYMQVYRSGDLMLVSQVLGHADHEDNGVMYLLFRHVLEAEGAIAPGVAVYNRWDSGTDGLRFLKARIGFEETPVEWLP